MYNVSILKHCNMPIPSLGKLALGKATRQLQEAFYKYISEILVPDFYGIPSDEELGLFEGVLKEGIQVSKCWLNFLWKVLEGDEWSEPGVQLEHFEEWICKLHDYTSATVVSGLKHHKGCIGSNCCIYLCTFHRLNAEQSLYVYNDYLDYDRHPITGELRKVYYLDAPFYCQL